MATLWANLVRCLGVQVACRSTMFPGHLGRRRWGFVSRRMIPRDEACPKKWMALRCFGIIACLGTPA